MQSACESGAVWAALEGTAGSGALPALYSAVREAWLTRGLLQYHARTGSARALDVLARAPDLHAKLLLDAINEELCAERQNRHRALAALAPLAARRPSWLHRLAAHPAARALTRAARGERDTTARLNALLALAALAAHEPAAAAALLPELADALLRAAAAPEPHLQLAAHALFHALYAAQPVTLIEALRVEYSARDQATRERLQRVLPPILQASRLHPLLVLHAGGRRSVDGRRFELESPRGEESPAPVPPAPAPPSPAPLGAAATASRAVAALRPPTEPWFPLTERCGADSAPHTPLPPEATGEGGSPPEAAVEATPENTPAKESRAHFTFPAESGAARALGRLSQPPSPLRKESSPGPGLQFSGGTGEGYSGRLARVVLERARAAPDSPIPFGGAPPAAAARPEPRNAEPEEPLNVEDREVLELTSRSDDVWPEVSVPIVCAPPRRRPHPRRAAVSPARRVAVSPPRRAASCPPAPPARTRDAAVQTVETAPEPYEFIIQDYFKAFNEEQTKERLENGITADGSVRPSARLDAYLARLYAGGAGAAGGAGGELAEALALTHAALMFERWRREAHAERCRRLLGRCRQARALELNNLGLRDRVRGLQRELESCRARARPPPASPAARARPPPASPAALADDHAARLAAALANETLAREQAEAKLKEVEEIRLAEAGELRSLRGAAWEAARRVEALAAAAAAAERRAEHVRRMRRELLVLHERDEMLRQSAVTSHSAASAAEAAAARAAREEAAAARAEAEAATTRAEAAVARQHDLEQALQAKDNTCLELRKTIASACEEHTARLAALQDKYRALLHVQRRMEARRLELLAGSAPPAPPAASPHSSPLSASLGSGEGALAGPALADCSRLRHLLEDDDPASNHH